MDFNVLFIAQCRISTKHKATTKTNKRKKRSYAVKPPLKSKTVPKSYRHKFNLKLNNMGKPTSQK